METLERNRQNAMAFYDLMFNQCMPAEAIRRYVGDTYMQSCRASPPTTTPCSSARVFDG